MAPWVLLLLIAGAVRGLPANGFPFSAAHPPTATGGPTRETAWDLEPLAAALVHVDAAGLVDYRGLLEDRLHLDRYLRNADRLSPETYRRWNREEQLAFWINLYNALTLQLILDHYPIQPSFTGRFLYPRNSIRQISGAWTDTLSHALGRTLSLDAIEHDILRHEFADPRIHLALVCASRSCPPLRGEPYDGSALDSQLDDQAVRFLARPENFHFSADGRTLYLSKIFDWYGADFAAFAPAIGSRTGFTGPAAGVVGFIARHVNEAQRRRLTAGGFRLAFSHYDWTLNEQED